jgi:hypothetical protein
MKKVFLLVTLLLGSAGSTVLQAQNPLTSLPPFIYDPKFRFPEPLPTFSSPFNPTDPALGYQGQPAQISHNIQHDIDGNLAFFIVDNMVYDRSGRAIGNLGDHVRGTDETVIVPDPSNCQRYFIFLGGGLYSSTGNSFFPYYSVVNMDFSLNGNFSTDVGTSTEGFLETFEAVDLRNVLINPRYDETVKDISPNFAVSKLRADNTRYVFISNARRVYKMIIDANGNLIYNNENFAVEGVATVGSPKTSRTEFELHEFSNGTYRMAIPYADGDNAMALEIINLDNTGMPIAGTRQNVVLQPNDIIKGVEFSPNGEIVYFTVINTGNTSGGGLYYYDLSSSSLTQLYNGSTFGEYRYSHIELKNDVLLFAKNDALGILPTPNTPSASFNFSFQEINYSPNFMLLESTDPSAKVYLLPDQIDGMDYFAHFYVDPVCCVRASNFNIESFTAATGNQTWSYGLGNNPFNATLPVTVQTELRIPAGANITINNMVFEFAPGASLVIERGTSGQKAGQLTLNGTLLTIDDRCSNETMWRGVEVLGFPTVANTNQQGLLVMRNESKIEHAVNGVTVQGGGIINANNSTFENNQRDVVFLASSVNNTSKFIQCNFITTNLLRDPSRNLSDHVSMTNISGVSFLGCHFQNVNLAFYPISILRANTRGVGIRSFNSKFTVDAFCAIPTKCTNPIRGRFEGLSRGIVADGLANERSVYVDRQDFINNHFGITLRSINLSTIIRNTFDVSTTTGLVSVFGNPVRTYGISLEASTGYKVEENNFRSSFPSQEIYGIIVTNSGEDDNEIYKNTFRDLNVGIQAQGDNGIEFCYLDVNGNKICDKDDPSLVNTYTGLQILCNRFISPLTTADLAVTSGEINYHQGFCSGSNTILPAGNQFSFTNIEIFTDPDIQLFEYDHHNSAITKPLNYGSKVELDECNAAFDPTKSCPTKIQGPRDPGVQPPGDFPGPGRPGVVAPDILDEINKRRALIDGGNTDQLLAELANPNSKAVRERLLSVSPYLSDKVLLAFLDGNRPATDVRDIMLANSPLSKTVIERVEAKNLAKPMLNAIKEVQYGESAMQVLMKEISALNSNREYWVNEYIRYQLNDEEEPTPIDNIIEVLTFETSINHTHRIPQLADFYIANHDVESAQGVIDGYTSIVGENAYKKLAKVQIELIEMPNMKELFETHPSLKNDITEVAQNQNDRFYQARGEAVLSMLDNVLYIPVIEDIILSQGRSGSETIDVIFSEQQAVSIYPNPSKTDGSVVFTINRNTTANHYTIEAVNMLGSKVLLVELNEEHPSQTVSHAFAEKGIYFLKITNNQGETSFRKLVVE